MRVNMESIGKGMVVRIALLRNERGSLTVEETHENSESTCARSGMAGRAEHGPEQNLVAPELRTLPGCLAARLRGWTEDQDGSIRSGEGGGHWTGEGARTTVPRDLWR